MVQYPSPLPVYQLTEEQLKNALADAMRQGADKEREDARRRAADELLTRKDVAQLLGVSFSTLWRWSCTGYLAPVRLGANVRYRRADVYELLKQTPA